MFFSKYKTVCLINNFIYKSIEVGFSLVWSFSCGILTQKITFCFVNNLRQICQLCWWNDCDHLVVKSVLLWLNLLDSLFKQLYFVDIHQGTIVVVVILLFPELSIVLAFIIGQIVEIFIFFIVIFVILRFILTIILRSIFDSLFCILLDQLYESLEKIREDLENIIRLLRVFHQTRQAQNDSLSLVFLFVTRFIW